MGGDVIVLDPNAAKVAVCEYLLQVNRDHDPDNKGYAFIPPTAIDWLGNGIVSAILATAQEH